MRTRMFVLATIVTCSVATAPSTMAATVGQEAAGESHLGFLLAGTLITWLGFFAYAFYLGRKNRDLRRDLEELRRSIDGRTGPNS